MVYNSHLPKSASVKENKPKNTSKFNSFSEQFR